MTMAGGGKALLILVLLLTAVAPTPINAFLFAPSEGKIESEHSLFFVGENVTLHCVKTSGSFSAEGDKVTFKAGNDVVPKNFVTILNGTTVRMSRPALEGDPPSTNYGCNDGSNFIGSAAINTEYQPREPSDLQVRWYDRTALQLSWDLGKPYNFRPDSQNAHNPITQVQASYSLDGSSWYPCPPVKIMVPIKGEVDSNSSCQVDSFQHVFALSLRVTVSNTRRNGYEATTIRNISSIANHEKPKPVENLIVSAWNSTCAGLIWSQVRSELGAVILYGIKGEPLNHEEEVPLDVYDWTICGLHPFKTYTFQVHATPSRGYRSEPEFRDLLMPEDGRGK